MRAAKMTGHPSFSLMKQTDIQNLHYMKMPLWLFSDSHYADMSLDAKVTYTFLLNRFQLSRMKGWINDCGEVFVIFPRLALAKELRVCEKRITAAFRCLAERKLIWEKRCGRGDANQIYLAKVEPEADSGYQCAPFIDAENECGSRTADLAVLAEEAALEPQDLRSWNGEKVGSEAVGSAVLEPQVQRSSKKERRKIEQSQKKVSLSVSAASVNTDRQDHEEAELVGILDACELYCFEPETARVFENAIERLFYSDSFRIGNATLPQSRVRSKLHLLDSMVLRDAEAKLHANLEHSVKNSTAYTMAVVFNCIAEGESDLLIDPYLNSLRAPPGKG